MSDSSDDEPLAVKKAKLGKAGEKGFLSVFEAISHRGHEKDCAFAMQIQRKHLLGSRYLPRVPNYSENS